MGYNCVLFWDITLDDTNEVKRKPCGNRLPYKLQMLIHDAKNLRYRNRGACNSLALPEGSPAILTVSRQLRKYEL